MHVVVLKQGSYWCTAHIASSKTYNNIKIQSTTISNQRRDGVWYWASMEYCDRIELAEALVPSCQWVVKPLCGTSQWATCGERT